MSPTDNKEALAILDDLVEQLHSPDIAIRVEAATAILEIGYSTYSPSHKYQQRRLNYQLSKLKRMLQRVRGETRKLVGGRAP